MKTLIFYESIVEPPSDSLAVRGVCLYLKIFQKECQILLEAEKSNRDLYYNWAKHTGLWDFVEDIVCPADDIFGLRISNTKVRSPFIRVDRIAYENLNDLLARIY
jgi:hypothetical protein|tara:strand:+ start:314 stop:628 length:315 start_codon:yes stop_codon:yes gene_type:complete